MFGESKGLTDKEREQGFIFLRDEGMSYPQALRLVVLRDLYLQGKI